MMIVIGTQGGDPLPLLEKLKNLLGLLREQNGAVLLGGGAQEVVHEAYRKLTTSINSERFPSVLKVFEGLGLWRCLRDRKMDAFGDVGPILPRIAAADLETMIELLRGRRSASPARTQWNKNQDRDRIILNCLERGMPRAMVCEELDKRTISTLPGLLKKGLHTWKGAWKEPAGRQAIQQLFSKLTKRQKAVKPLDVSE